jgi:hypothetical protein
MDDLVVIILTLLIAGAGVIGQLKKKKHIPVDPEAQKNPENFWDLFKQETFPSVPRDEPEYEELELEKPVPYVNEQNYKFNAKNEGGALISNKIKKETPAQEIIKKKEERFSLRKAVIYSEILNRKYI